MRLVQNVPMLRETRWTAKYQTIRILTNHFEDIHKQLGILAATAYGKTSQDAHQLQYAPGTLMLCMVIMAKYSAILEPVTQDLQAVQLDVLNVHDHIQQLLFIFEIQKREAEVRFKEDIMVQADKIAKAVGIELLMPRQCGRLTLRPNYYHVAIFIPYMDSINKSLGTRTAPDNNNHFALFYLHPVLLSRSRLFVKPYLLR